MPFPFKIHMRTSVAFQFKGEIDSRNKKQITICAAVLIEKKIKVACQDKENTTTIIS